MVRPPVVLFGRFFSGAVLVPAPGPSGSFGAGRASAFQCGGGGGRQCSLRRRWVNAHRTGSLNDRWGLGVDLDRGGGALGIGSSILTPAARYPCPSPAGPVLSRALVGGVRRSSATACVGWRTLGNQPGAFRGEPSLLDLADRAGVGGVTGVQRNTTVAHPPIPAGFSRLQQVSTCREQRPQQVRNFRSPGIIEVVVVGVEEFASLGIADRSIFPVETGGAVHDSEVRKALLQAL